MPLLSVKYLTSVLYLGFSKVSGKTVRKPSKVSAFDHSSSDRSPSIVILKALEINNMLRKK